MLCLPLSRPAIAQTYQGTPPGNNLSPYSGLLLSIDYASNTNVMGAFPAQTRQPFVTPSLMYSGEWNLDVSFMAIFADNSDDSLENFTGEYDIQFGYNLYPLSNLDFYISYSHYFYSNRSHPLKTLFSNDFHVDGDFTPGWFFFGGSAGYLWGNYGTFYSSIRSGGRIEAQRFLFRNLAVSVQPTIDVFFGNFTYLNQFYIDQIRDFPGYYNYLLLYPEVWRYFISEKRKNPGYTRMQIIDSYLDKHRKDDFGISSVSISLPLLFTFRNWSFSAGAALYIPVNQPAYLSNETQFYFNAGLAYSIIFP